MIFKHENQTLELLKEKAIYWHEESALIISDLHIGKANSFRKNGFAIPGNSERDINRIKSLIKSFRIDQIIILGDLFHFEENEDWKLFQSLISEYSQISWHLVLGNHDQKFLKKADQSWSALKVYESLYIGPYYFVHKNEGLIEEEKFVWSGHVHPKFKIQGKAKQSATLPCFYIGKASGILPSFGSFTGGYLVDKNEGDSIYLITKEKIIQVL